MRKGGVKACSKTSDWRLGGGCRLVMHGCDRESKKMDVDALTNENQPGEIGRHARDYSRFITMFKWGAIVSFILAMLVLVIIA